MIIGMVRHLGVDIQERRQMKMSINKYSSALKHLVKRLIEKVTVFEDKSKVEIKIDIEIIKKLLNVLTFTQRNGLYCIRDHLAANE